MPHMLTKQGKSRHGIQSQAGTGHPAQLAGYFDARGNIEEGVQARDHHNNNNKESDTVRRLLGAAAW